MYFLRAGTTPWCYFTDLPKGSTWLQKISERNKLVKSPALILQESLHTFLHFTYCCKCKLWEMERAMEISRFMLFSCENKLHKRTIISWMIRICSWSQWFLLLPYKSDLISILSHFRERPHLDSCQIKIELH